MESTLQQAAETKQQVSRLTNELRHAQAEASQVARSLASHREPGSAGCTSLSAAMARKLDDGLSAGEHWRHGMGRINQPRMETRRNAVPDD